jgi:hypothetical protein
MAGVDGCGGSRADRSATTKPVIAATVSAVSRSAVRLPSSQPPMRISSG